MRKTKTRSALKYVLLPGIIPQAKGLFASGFGYIAFLMAQIYAMVRLLPANHPYLQSANIGHFGVRHVIVEAANRLELKKKNWDQVTIFVALLFGIILLAGQIALIIFSLIFQPAMAAVSTDIAFTLLDQVFGIPKFFCDPAGLCTAVLADGKWPFHTALHEMFRFYSIGLLMIAVIVFLYYIVVVVGETATSGSPFGQRFQNIWVPIRLVVALGLLTPIHHGLNSAQYITLSSAKIGSNLATDAWKTFNKTLGTEQGKRANPSGETDSLLALPTSPDVSPIVQFMSIAHACAYTHWRTNSDVENNDLSKAPPYYNGTDKAPNQYVQPYYVKSSISKGEKTLLMSDNNDGSEYLKALEFYGGGDIIIRFGLYGAANLNEPSGNKDKGGVEPTCGEIRLATTDLTNVGKGDTLGGAALIQEYYFDLIQLIWFFDNSLSGLSQRSAEFSLQKDMTGKLICKISCDDSALPSCTEVSKKYAPKKECEARRPDKSAMQTYINGYNASVESYVVSAWELYNENAIEIGMEEKVMAYGWAGAGVWYNTIGKINGSFITAVTSIPQPVKYPLAMERVRAEKLKVEPGTSGLSSFQPTAPHGKTLAITSETKTMAGVLHELYKDWNTDGGNQSDNDKMITGNAFEDVMNMMFGTRGLFEMRNGENAYVHPLAQLSALGKGLVDSAITNIAISSAAGALGGPLTAIGSKHAGAAAGIVSGLFGSTAFMGLTAGVILYYVLPFLPFVYFFFAVGAWVKGIFEAMVGVPLWALAHLRLDGEGLAGDAAIGGYQLILEIAIRPILTVFGLIASMIIFTTQVRILNIIWDLVIDNVGGFTGDTTIGLIGEKKLGFHIQRSILDQFFFTITYAIIVYMMATASFKLINLIPNTLLRWMGAGVSAFGDMQTDVAAQLTQKAGMGGMTIGQQVVGGIKQVAGGTGKALGDMIESGKTSGTNTPKDPPIGGSNA